MALIKGKTVTLYQKVKSGKDSFNHDTYTETSIDVENVLITPVSSEAIVNELQLSGKRLVYELCIPKGDTHTWDDSKVGFYGETWHTFGYPEEWIDENVPLLWNKKIKVERYG